MLFFGRAGLSAKQDAIKNILTQLKARLGNLQSQRDNTDKDIQTNKDSLKLLGPQLSKYRAELEKSATAFEAAIKQVRHGIT